MHRVPRALLLLVVLGALAAGAFLALGRDGAHANPDPVITVNGYDDFNSRDGQMTLREAVMLATGDLSVTAVSQGECYRISPASWDNTLGCSSGDPPGASSADTIVFDSAVFPTGSPATIVLIPGFLNSGLPSLSSGSDTIDASTAGVVVDGAGASSCFHIGSDGNAIKGLQIFNCGTGVEINGGLNNTIGGSTPAERNVISANGRGVFIAGSGNTIKGNYIGTDAAGTAALPNNEGVYLSGGGQNTVGGSTPAERNVISGNMYGVHIQGDSNSVKGNYIGTDAAGTAALPNGTGVHLLGGAQDNSIGGTAPGEGNVIAFNTGSGVYVDGHYDPPNKPHLATTANTIRGNSIHSNGGLGIDNYIGGNNELAPPVITGFGSVIGTACANCDVDVYSDDDGQGKVYEGSTTADGAGNWTFDGSPQGPNVTATATDAAGNTSEFSAPVLAPEATPTSTPTPTVSPTPTSTPTPTATPGGTLTPTPTGATRILQWGVGWNNATWSGSGGTAPSDAFACAAGKYAAAYRYVAGGLERYFPDRPDISNMGPLAQYDAFLILVTEPVTCTMPVAATAGSSRTLQWEVGWNNGGWSGADGTAPQQAFACADGSYAAAYRYVAGGLERYFPGRADISNMGPLNKYDAFLILVTAPVSCAMPVGP